MAGCRDGESCVADALRGRQGKVLKIVLAINALMFLVEMGAGMASHSMALMGDSLDMLGDALVYGFSLYVLARSAKWRAWAALSKGLIMLVFGLGVLGMAVDMVGYSRLPIAETMGSIGFLALAANLVCLLLLTRHRHDDLNMQSVWLCSRNDIAANIGVLLAAVAVAYTASPWPDRVIGLIVAALFLISAFHVMTRALAEIKIA